MFRPGGDKLWLFGGFNSAGLQSDLYHYNTTIGWQATAQNNVPVARELHALAWHADHGLLVMFGGQKVGFPSYVDLSELQVYNPSTQGWTLIGQGSPLPEARRGATFFWVPHLGRFLLFGGVNGFFSQTRFNDLWLLNLVMDTQSGVFSASWSQLSPSGVAMPALNNVCSGYDPVQRRLIVFGGEAASGDATSAVYQYLFDSNSWQLDSPNGALPPDRSYAQCAWDPGIGRLVAYGGQDDTGPPLEGCYLYDPLSQVWSWLPPPASPPAGSYPGLLSDGSASYSEALGGVVWFGGRKATTTYTNETWLMTVP